MREFVMSLFLGLLISCLVMQLAENIMLCLGDEDDDT